MSEITPATRISQGRNGQWYTLNVLMQYGQPVSLDLALKRVAIGRTVFVRREDAARVMEAKVADLALPKSGYVWAILWYPGGRKEFVEIEPEKVHSLDESYSRLKSNRKTYVALANAAAVARMGW